MKKSFKVCFSYLFAFLFLFLSVAPVFAKTGVTIRSKLPEPQLSDNSVYWANPNGLIQFSFMPINDYSGGYYSPGSDSSLPYGVDLGKSLKVSVSITPRDDSDTGTFIKFTFTNLSNQPIQVYGFSYNLETGALKTSYPPFTVPAISSGGSISRSYTFGVNYSSYWFGANIEVTSSYDQLLLSWSDTIDYSSDFAAIQELLGSIEFDIAFLGNHIIDYFTWFKGTYYDTITGKWNLSNAKLDQIIDLLGGNATITEPDTAVNSELESGVGGYVESESGYMDQFDSGLEDVNQEFKKAENFLSNSSNSFSLIKDIFESFTLGPSYWILFFSMAFGVLLLILGRKVA